MKEDASLQNHFKKGISTLVALSLLQNQRMYGYELVQTMEKVSGGRFVLQDSASMIRITASTIRRTAGWC